MRQVILDWSHDPDSYRAFLRELLDGARRDELDIYELAWRHGAVPVLRSDSEAAVVVPLPRRRVRRQPRWQVLGALMVLALVGAGLLLEAVAWVVRLR